MLIREFAACIDKLLKHGAELFDTIVFDIKWCVAIFLHIIFAGNNAALIIIMECQA